MGRGKEARAAYRVAGVASFCVLHEGDDDSSSLVGSSSVGFVSPFWRSLGKGSDVGARHVSVPQGQAKVELQVSFQAAEFAYGVSDNGWRGGG